jgi:hypothetical protein
MAVDDDGDRRQSDGGGGLNVTSAEALAAANEGAQWRIRRVPPAHSVLLNQLVNLNISWVQDSMQVSPDGRPSNRPECDPLLSFFSLSLCLW